MVSRGTCLGEKKKGGRGGEEKRGILVRREKGMLISGWGEGGFEGLWEGKRGKRGGWGGVRFFFVEGK